MDDPPSTTATANKTLTTLLQAQAQAQSSPSPTPHDKKVYTLLLQIPPGSFTTYAILATILNSSPRAIGNACRRNPFAPSVPCHRVIATGGALGGFKGQHLRKTTKSQTNTNAKALLTLEEKRQLLRKEGVKFDLRGDKVLGTPFMGFS